MVTLIAVVTGLVALCNQMKFPKKFSLVLAIVFGVGLNVFVTKDEASAQVLINGLIIGLSSVGLYSGPKNIKQGIENIIKEEE